MPPTVGMSALARDMVWVPQHRLLYMSLPSENGPAGNVVVAVDPLTNKVVHRREAGSDPGLLAATDDGRYLYVVIAGTSTVQRFLLPELQPESSFALPRGRSGLDTKASAIATIPGRPRSLVVCLDVPPIDPQINTQWDLLVFDDGVARPEGLATSCESIAVSAAGDRAFVATDGEVRLSSVRIEERGLSREWEKLFISLGYLSHPIQYEASANAIYTSNGFVIDAASAEIVARLDLNFQGGAASWDASRNRLHFALPRGAIRSFDTTTWRPISRPNYYPGAGTGKRLVRWGDNRWALSTNVHDIAIFGGSGTSDFDASTPRRMARERVLPIGSGRIVWDPVSARLYATVRSDSASSPDSVAEIDVDEGRIVRSRVVGQDLGPLAVSSDGRYLFVGVDSEGAVRRLQTRSLEPDLTVPLEQRHPWTRVLAGLISTLPGQPESFAVQPVSSSPPRFALGALEVIDGARPRPVPPSTPGAVGGSISVRGMVWDDDGRRLHAMSDLGRLLAARADAGGVVSTAQKEDHFAGADLLLDRVNRRLVTGAGVFDPVTLERLASFGGGWRGIGNAAIDDTAGVVYGLHSPRGPDNTGRIRVEITVIDLQRFTTLVVHGLGNVRSEWHTETTDFIALGAGRLVYRAETGLHIVQLDAPR
jgi:DNA-binding beta-propeller fold protein YncE